MAGNGYTTRQVIAQVEKAESYKPKYYMVLAGTNDLFELKDSVSTIDVFTATYSNLLQKLKACGGKVVITLIPYQSSTRVSDLVDSMNNRIKVIAMREKIHYIDLNENISENRRLKDEFTIDGVHFSTAAYDIWVDMLKSTVSKLK